MRWWNRYHSRRSSSGITSRLRRRRPSSSSAEPVRCSTSSHSRPESRSRHDASIRNARDVGIELGRAAPHRGTRRRSGGRRRSRPRGPPSGPVGCGGRGRRGRRRRASPRSARRAGPSRPRRRRAPRSARRIAASSASNASSAGPTSTRRRRTRSRPSGSGTAVRLHSTMVDPGGISATSTGRMSRTSRLDELVDVVEDQHERAAPVGDHRAELLRTRPCRWSVSAPRAPTRSADRRARCRRSPSAMYVSSAAGSLSAPVSDSQPTGRGSSATSSATNVDLP